MSNTASKLIDTAMQRLAEAKDALESKPKPKPGPVDLGEWEGWKLTWGTSPDCARVQKEGLGGVFWPGFEIGRLGYSTACINALLTAYRRAVARGLATWPEGWEWAKDEPMFDAHCMDSHVYLGRISQHHDIDLWWRGSEPHVHVYLTPELAWKPVAEFRAALLGLCEAKPAPCRRWGQCTSLAKAELQPCCGCASYEPDEPAPDAKARRMVDAGATQVIPGMGTIYAGDLAKGSVAFVYENGIVLNIYTQNEHRAEAALRAATGKTDGTFIPEWLHNEKLAIKEAQLAVKDRAIAELEEKVRMCAADIAAAQTEAKRLKGEIAKAMSSIEATTGSDCHCQLCQNRRAWLARNKEA